MLQAKDTNWLKIQKQTVKFQDTKLIHRNPLNSYTLTIKNLKGELRKQSYSQLQQNK